MTTISISTFFVLLILSQYPNSTFKVHPNSLEFGGKPLLTMLKAFRDESSVMVYIQLDHTTEERYIYIALESGGVDCIMVDGSALGFDENVQWTKTMVPINFIILV
jgi:fructose/tagatose bisphosphate aldolase